MKKKIWIVLIVSMFFVSGFSNVQVCKADDNDKNIVKEKMDSLRLNKEEQTNVKEVIEEYTYQSNDTMMLGVEGNNALSNIDLENAFQMYILPDLFLSLYDKENGLISLISQDKLVSLNVISNNDEDGRSFMTLDDNNEAEFNATVLGVRDDAVIPELDVLTDMVADNISNYRRYKICP